MGALLDTCIRPSEIDPSAMHLFKSQFPTMHAITIFVVAFLGLIAVSSAQLTVRTNVPTFISSDVWSRTGRNGSVVNGPIASSPPLFLNNRVYLQVSQAMIALDLNLNTSTALIQNSTVLPYALLPTLAASIADPLVRLWPSFASRVPRKRKTCASFYNFVSIACALTFE
jgi:hypothetical protein